MEYQIIGGDGNEYGPISPEGVRDWIQKGSVNADTRIKVVGTEHWQAVRDLPEFADAFSKASPPAASPPPAAGQPPRAPSPKTNVLAIISLICGIVSLPMVFCCYGLPFNLIGMVTGGIAILQINKDPENMTGKGMAIGGIVASLLSLVMVLLFVFFYAGFLGIALLGSM